MTLVSSIILFFYTKSLLQDQVEESLFSTEARVVDALQNGQMVSSLSPVTEIKKVDEKGIETLKDTIIYDPSQNEMEEFREWATFEEIDGQIYQITVRNLVVESGDILIAIVLSYIGMFILAFLVLFFFNTSKNIKLWHPFFNNLEQMKKFSLSSPQDLQLEDSDVLEFSELKEEIQSLTSKVRSEYDKLKQFTEDVSHEMQTPLAIIQAKMDNIINEHFINDRQFEQMSSIQKDIQRLKHLNKRITLLTKIDNHQFINRENVNITNLAGDTIEDFREIGRANITLNSPENLIVSMDTYLASILINNLISNAIKHSPNEREIVLETSNHSLTVSNFGERELLHPDKLFIRFYREANSIKSTGLGLAIVKQICDLYGFRIVYSFHHSHHIFQVDFNFEEIE